MAKTQRAADGVEEKAEDRAAEIAEKIGECAREQRVLASDLTWEDFRAYASLAWGQNRVGIVRRDITRLGGFNQIRDAYFPKDASDQQVTRLRLRQHANLNRRVGADVANQTFVLKEFERLADKIFRGRIKPVSTRWNKPARRRLDPKKMVSRALALSFNRAIVAVLSDLHFGSDLKASETGFLDYGVTEEARRIAKVTKQICEYKLEYRHETELHLCLDGDIIHGKLHDQQDGAPKAWQFGRALHLLSQVIAQVAAHFVRVTVHCVTGNHGRDLTRHFGRATVGKYDSEETKIYLALKYAAARLPNVTFSIPTTPYDVFELYGKRYFVTHGDTVLTAGNPGKKLETGKLENQINRWNASVGSDAEFSVFILGHVHTPVVHHASNNAWIVINGCLLPADNFCVSIGLPETVSDQVMFEAVPGHPVGDVRFITLDRTTDKDASLDQIIQPWPGP